MRQSLAAGEDMDVDADAFDIGALLTKLWAGRWLMVLCTGLGIFTGLFLFATTAKTWQAGALLQLESKGGQLGLPKESAGLTESGSETATELEIIRSRLVRGQATATRHLDWLAASATRMLSAR